VSSPLLVLERAVAISTSLTAASVGHAFRGALALAYHVSDPRGTNDIDVNVTCDPDRPEMAFAALPADLPWGPEHTTRAARDGQVRLLWPQPGGVGRPVPVDIFLPQHDFHAVAASRTENVPMLQAQVPILSATDLTVFKALFDRTKDWADIEELLRYGSVDLAEVLRWLTELLGAEDPRLSRMGEAARTAASGAGTPTAAELFRPPDR
jgi:hypothetical protein